MQSQAEQDGNVVCREPPAKCLQQILFPVLLLHACQLCILLVCLQTICQSGKYLNIIIDDQQTS